MTVELIAAPGDVAARLGEAFGEQLTYPGIYRGAPSSVSPVIVERDGQLTVVIAHADSQACRTLDPEIRCVVYGNYFDWDREPGHTPLSFEQAVRDVAGPEPLLCDRTLPLARFRALARTGPVILQTATPTMPVQLYRKPRVEIEAQWRSTRDADATAFAPFVHTLRDGDALAAAMTTSLRGFAPLDTLCSQLGFSLLCVTSPHELEMFTGLPKLVCEQHGVSALFRPGEPDITVVAERPLQRADFRPAGQATSLLDAVRIEAAGLVAIQTDHLAAGLGRAFEATFEQLEDAAYVLHRWQDQRAGDDAVYFFVAAHAVLAGIEAARVRLRRDPGALLSELDLVAAFRMGVGRFAARFGFEGRVGGYFEIVHSGARTLLPATAGHYPVSVRDRTIKFDMGLTVADGFGCVRAVSDIARPICAEPALEAMHDRLRRLLIDRLIPAIKPGMSGAEIHAAGVALLRPLEGELRRLGLLPDGRGVDGYLRDCGHTIQRQTIASVYFSPSVRERVEQGMLGCVEYVWPIGDVLLAVEDGYVITPDGCVAFTAAGSA